MEISTAIKLAQCSDNQLVMSNALLTLANVVMKDEGVASQCISILKPLMAHRSRIEKVQEIMIRLYASCTCAPGVGLGEVEKELAGLFLNGLKSTDIKIQQVSVLGMGNLCCDSRTAREIITQSDDFKELLVQEPKSDHLLGLLANVSVDFPSEQLAQAVAVQSTSNPNASFALANCVRAKCARVRKEQVEEMLRSSDQCIQESGLDIIANSSASAIGPSPALCWMTEHVNSKVQEKARKEIQRFVDADLLAIVERGCVPVLWQLSVSDGSSVAQNGNQVERSFGTEALKSLKERLTPTVHQLLLRTLSMEGNEVLRGHVGVALVHLAPEVIADIDALSSVLSMLDSTEGKQPVLEFLQAIHAHVVLGYSDQQDDTQELLDPSVSIQEICNLLESKDAKCKGRRDQAFSLLLDRFEDFYSTTSKQGVQKALYAICSEELKNISSKMAEV